MKLRRLRLRLTLLFAVVMVGLAIGPLLLWRSAAADRVRDDFEDLLVEQMEAVQRASIIDDDAGVWFPAWFVNANEGWFDAIEDWNLEPPLITWAQTAGSSPSFRSYSQDGDRFQAYVNPLRSGVALVTLNSTEERDDDLSSVDRRTLLLGLLLVAAATGLGWIGAGLALGPTRRLIDDQQGFLADAAHEMRTPLAVIQASSSQALARERSSEEYVRSLSEIRSAAERAATGVNELLDLVRFDSGQAIPRLAPLRLDLLAEEVAASVRTDDASVTAEPHAPVVVDADMALLRQALDNVVRNAVRRSEHVELCSRVEGRFGVIDVIDDGPGFDPEALPRIFDRYQRGDRRGEVGLGLAIVKAIMVAHGGDVRAANRSADEDADATSASRPAGGPPVTHDDASAAPVGGRAGGGAMVSLLVPLADH